MEDSCRKKNKNKLGKKKFKTRMFIIILILKTMFNSFEFIGEEIIDSTIDQTPAQIEIVPKVISDIEGSKRSLAGETSAANCVVSGTGISGTLTAFTTYTVTVTAKDSSGVDVGHGGDKFRVEIYNKCTMGSNSICNTVSGARQTLSATIYAAMTDNSDGTYTYNFSVQLDGEVAIIVRLVNTGIVNCKWYSNTSTSGSPVKTNTTSNINFSADGSAVNFIPGQGEYFSGIIYGSIASIASGVYTFTWRSDDGSQVVFNGNVVVNRFGQIGVFSDTFSVSLIYGGYYDFTIYYLQGPRLITLELLWSASFIGNQDVPSTSFTTYNLIGSSPFQVTTVCPTGYTGSDPTSTTKCKEICGDGIKVGSEQCDDGNTINNDGCQSDCTLITPGFACTGGGSTSKDVCSQCLTGYTPNSDKSACIAICGDGLRMTSELCDDGNLSNGDGCSNTCNIESGYSCAGGSTTSKDTCVVCSAGFYQDSSNPANCIPRCGDGLRAGSETCDDENTSSCDGCSITCSIESGYICNGGSITTKDTCTKCSSGFYPNSSKTECITSCGDGLRAGTEKCDDGNTSSGDGCKSDCSLIESGCVCSGGSTTSIDTCTKCGKGLYQNDSSNPSKCVTHCGDGIKAGEELCDDGNTISGDGCSSDCNRIEDGWACYGGWFGVTDVCIKCDLGYGPNPDYTNCIGAEAPRDVKGMAVAMLAAAYMGIAANLVLTMFSSSTSSSSNSFGMINQIQLVIILPLIGAYIPEKIYDYLKSMNTSLFNPNFTPTSNSSSTNSFKSLFDFKQQNSYLFLLQLNSGSVFVNIVDLSTTVGFVACLHVAIVILFIILRRIGRFAFLKKILGKLIKMLTFGFYVGVLLETFILFLLVDMSEIHYQNKKGSKNLNSTILSYIILSFIFLFMLLALWQWWKSRKPEVFETQKYFVTLVDGFKASWICRSYWLIFLIRRALFITIIFFMEDNSMLFKVIIFVTIQALYFAYIIILRPQESIKENLNDFINEVFYLFFVTFLIYFNTADRWTSTITDAYFWIMMSNNFILITIMLSEYFYLEAIVSTIKYIIVTIKNFCNKRKVKPKEKDESTKMEIVGTMQNHFDNNEISQSRVIEEEQKNFTCKNMKNSEVLNQQTMKLNQSSRETLNPNRKIDSNNLIMEDL